MTMRRAVVAVLLAAAPLAVLAEGGSTVYRCPGNVYTSEITEREAKERNCRTIENAPVTIVQTPKPPPVAARREGPAASGTRGSEGKVDPAAQRQRDSDARRILEAELKREEARLADLQQEFNNGEPERRGDERNNQRYIDRVAEMRAAIARKESDIAAIKRELAKLPQ